MYSDFVNYYFTKILVLLKRSRRDFNSALPRLRDLFICGHSFACFLHVMKNDSKHFRVGLRWCLPCQKRFYFLYLALFL